MSKKNKIFENFKKITSLDPTDRESTINIGYTHGIEHPGFIIKFMIAWVMHITSKLIRVEKHSDDYADLLGHRGFTYEEFRFAKDGNLPEDKYDRSIILDILYLDDAIEREKFRYKFEEDLSMKEQYLQAISKQINLENPVLKKSLLETKIPINLPIKAFHSHAYILAQSGSGKSELLKTITYELQRISHINRDKSIVLLDPHGDMAAEILRYKMNNGKGADRMIYLDTDINSTSSTLFGYDVLSEEYNFTINPFDVPDLSEKEIASYTENLAKAIFSLVDSQDTYLMETVLEACIETLIRRPNSDISDLIRFMDDENNDDLILFGSKMPNETRANFLANKFKTDGRLSSTKNSVYLRLVKLMGNPSFKSIVSGQSSVDLEKSMNSGKVVIVNLNKSAIGSQTSSAIGKFIIAQITIFGLKRAKIPKSKRLETYLIIDEFQNFVTDAIEEIMAETRKFRVYAILCHQQMGQNMSSQTKRLISGNTGLKFASENEPDSLEFMTSQMKHLTVGMIEKLPPYSFWVNDKFNKKAGTFITRVPSHLVDTGSKFYMSREESIYFFKYIANHSGIYIKAPKASKVRDFETVQKDSNPFQNPFNE